MPTNEGADLLRDERDDAAVGDSDRILHLCATARQAAAAGETSLALELAYAACARRFSAHVSSHAVSAVTSLAGRLARDRLYPCGDLGHRPVRHASQVLVHDVTSRGAEHVTMEAVAAAAALLRWAKTRPVARWCTTR